MTNLIILVVSSVAGSLGWWVGSFISIELAFLLSTAGSVAGIYYGWKWSRAYF